MFEFSLFLLFVFICLSVLIECHQNAGISVPLERSDYVKQGKAKKKQEILLLVEEYLSFSTTRGKQGASKSFFNPGIVYSNHGKCCMVIS